MLRSTSCRTLPKPFLRHLPLLRKNAMAPITTSAVLGSKQGSDASITPPPVLFNVQDTARVVTLNRPRKLNAINTEMSEMLFNTLNEYSKSDLINLIIIKSSNSPRSLSAGGDVATASAFNLAGEFDKSAEFFQKEYSMDLLLATFNKPIVTFMDGITMGGGVGLSIHAPFRISTENTKWAMPEMDIGFFPDVGVTFAMPRIITLANTRAQMALYLCLTGEILSGEDAYILGLSSHYVPHENLKNLEKRLCEIHEAEVYGHEPSIESMMDMIDGAIKEYSTQLPDGYKFRYGDEQLDVIEKCFDIHKVQMIGDIIRNLETYSGSSEAVNFALSVKERLLKKSVTSMNVAIRLMQDNSVDHIQATIRKDIFTAINMCLNNVDNLSEFTEAVKHKLIDKQKTPYNWHVKFTDEITPSQITSLISPKPSIPVSTLKNAINVTWNDYPYHYRYQMPTEKMIKEYIETSKPVDKEAALNYFVNQNSLTRDKPGIRHVVGNILRRHCDSVEGSTLRWMD